MWGIIGRLFLSLAPGVFFSDIMTAVGNMFNVKPKADGNYPVWFPLSLVAAFAIIIGFIWKFLFSAGKKKATWVYAGIAVSLFFPDFMQIDGNFSQAVALGVLTTGAAVVTTFNTTYIPRYFSYVAATQLTAVRISYQGGGVLVDLDGAGLTAVRAELQIGAVTNGTMIDISNGFIAGKNLIWEFTNSAVQTPTVYVGAEEKAGMSQAPPMVLTATKAQVLANSGTDFQDFSYLGIPAIGATDVVNVTYQDGLTQLFNRVDLQMLLQRVQAQVNTPDYALNNFDRNVKKVTITATAAFTAYVQMWQPIGVMLEAQLQ